jgi:starch-binding outer membrane protein, SusD/RagB family
MMRTARWARLAAVLVLAGVPAACDNFLAGEELTTDPNRPSVAELDQLFHGIQLTTFYWHNGNLARATSMWMQQMAGTDRQYITLDNYDFGQDEFSGEWDAIYMAGGLVDLRRVQVLAMEAGQRVTAGIAKVHEAMLIGMASSIWGPLPYSQAVSDVEKPEFDSQPEIYAAVQALLTEAIADLGAGGAGPGSLDLIYHGNTAAWIQAANTLKARFYMHWVEAQLAGNATAQTACGGNCLTNAAAAAQQGVSTSANDLKTIHSSTPGEQNFWYQFVFTVRPGYLSAGKTLVDLLLSRGDPRLAEYFAPASGQYVGASPGEAGSFSQLNVATRGAPGYDQPLVTYAETQLILAEVRARQANYPAARTHLNNARAAAGLGAINPADANVLNEVGIEKYIAMFQHIESWNDMKRNCTPALSPPGIAPALIARIYHSENEANTNPNTPALGSLFDRNINDTAACPLP